MHGSIGIGSARRYPWWIDVKLWTTFESLLGTWWQSRRCWGGGIYEAECHGWKLTDSAPNENLSIQICKDMQRCSIYHTTLSHWNLGPPWVLIGLQAVWRSWAFGRLSGTVGKLGQILVKRWWNDGVLWQIPMQSVDQFPWQEWSKSSPFILTFKTGQAETQGLRYSQAWTWKVSTFSKNSWWKLNPFWGLFGA